jgi:uncharacterized protein (TIGR04222 family)
MDIALLAAYLAWVAFVLGYAMVALRTGRTPRAAATPSVEHLDLYQAAFLTGGPARTTDVAVLALRATGSVHIGRDGTVTATGRGPADPVAMGVLRTVEQAGGAAPLAAVRYGGARSPEVQAVGDGLMACRLMRRRSTLRPLRRASKLVNLSAVGSMVAAIALSSAAVTLATVMFVGSIVLLLVGRLGPLWGRTGHTRRGMRYVLRLRRDAALQTGLERTVAGGAGLGAIAALGLDRLTDYELLDVFRQARVPAATAGVGTRSGGGGDGCGDAGCAAGSGGSGGSDAGNPSWCGSSSCADSGFKGSSCSGPSCSSSSWSCSSSSSGSCGSSSSGSSCGGGGGGSSCGGGSS